MRYQNLFTFLLFIISVSCKEIEVSPVKNKDLISNENLLLGNPSNATTDLTNANNFLLQKPQYTLSYSRDRGTPNWISWHVSKDWLGNAPRQDDFRADNTLQADWYRVTTSSYIGSGFDRGHNVPSADRTSSVDNNSATFLMTNIIPQAPKNNQETWANLEEYTRSQVAAGNEVYVIMGNYGIGGTGSTGTATTIDKGRVTVPARIWKVLVILPEGEDDLNRITTSTRVISIDTPNNNTLSSDWGTFRTNVDAIEQATGYDLLSNVGETMQKVIEGRTDNGSTK